jgi:L-aspartate oxidase
MTHTHALPEGSVLIVGAGLAGLFLALKLAPRPAFVLSPVALGEGSASAWAQGGLAAALAPDDNPQLHAADTIAAGAGLVEAPVAHLLAADGPKRVLDLIKLGVPFDRSSDGALALSLEAAHSRPRVARVKGDLAGRAIMDALVAAAKAADHITLIEGANAVALLETEAGVGGVLVHDPSARNRTGDRRRWWTVSRDDQPARRGRIRHGHGVARWGADCRPGIRTIPSHRHRYWARPRASRHRSPQRRRR